MPLQNIVNKFNPDLASGINATYLFEIPEEDNYLLTVQNGTCSLEKTTKEQAIKADVTLKANKKTWEEIFNGKLPAQMAFMLNKLEVQGDLPLALKLTQIFQ